MANKGKQQKTKKRSNKSSDSSHKPKLNDIDKNDSYR